jgi:hypothetical protein
MSYKVTKGRKNGERTVVNVRTTTNPVTQATQALKWWKAASADERGKQAIATASYIKQNQTSRTRQAALFARMYGNQPLWGPFGGDFNRMPYNNYPNADRPTFNLVQACVDTLVSKMALSKPRPVFLTDKAKYRQRNLAKQLNTFIQGELYQTEAFDIGKLVLRDACVLGDGFIKVLRRNDRVSLERTLPFELLVDYNDGMYGRPQSLYQVKLIDRDVLVDCFPEKKAMILAAEQGFRGDQDVKTASDQVIVVEAWHLKSGPEANDGAHIIACSAGTLHDDTDWNKDSFPFVHIQFSPRLVGYFGQGLTEQLMGTQIEINKLLITISRAINLVGVPRVLLENGSKVVKAHINDQIGAILTYSGVKPEFINAMSNHPELYAQLQRLIEYGFQQCGVSMLAASSAKPEGLDSGAALREFDGIQSDRFSTLQQTWDTLFSDLSYLITEEASDIAKETGKYQTVYPNKDGTQEVDLPKADLLKDSYVIQCFNTSSLPRDPAGRKAYVTELLQAGMIDIKEARRLLDYPDLQQNEQLENAAEERILKALDEIVEDGKMTPPDSFLPPDLCIKLSNQYINLYAVTDLDDEKLKLLRTYNAQAVALQQAAQMAMIPPAAPPGAPGAPAQAQPQPLPQSPMLPRTS